MSVAVVVCVSPCFSVPRCPAAVLSLAVVLASNAEKHGEHLDSQMPGLDKGRQRTTEGGQGIMGVGDGSSLSLSLATDGASMCQSPRFSGSRDQRRGDDGTMDGPTSATDGMDIERLDRQRRWGRGRGFRTLAASVTD